MARTSVCSSRPESRQTEAAKAQHHECWSGSIRNWEPYVVVLLNPGKPLKQELQTTPQAA
jgi:hypothetical protein